MKTFDIIQITRSRLRYTVSAETMAEAKRIFVETGGTLKDDETLEINEETVIERDTGEDVTDAWSEIDD